MPVSSEENTCKEHFLGRKEHAIDEDGEVRASLLLSEKPVSSEENTCKQDCLGVKEHVIEEDGEVRASLLLSEKPVSSQEIMCKKDCLEVKELASKEDVEFFFLKDKNSSSQFKWENILKHRNVHREDDE
eukprot:11204318-Ditylum_brightwellii.AAC.1